MRIGIDCRLWNETGVGRYIRNLVEQLLIVDHNNTYVLFIRSVDQQKIKYQISKIKNEFKIENLKLKIVATDIHWHSTSEQIKFPQVLYKENLDLVHFPYFSLPIFYNRPFVVTIHDLIINHFPTGKASTLPYPLYQLKRMGYDVVMRHAINNSAKIIVPLNAVKDDLIETYGIAEDKVVVTYEGVEETLYFSSERKRVEKFGKDSSRLRSNNNYFLYVGNAYPHKNLEFLIEAFVEFRKETKDDVRLILVGKDDFFYKRFRKKVEEQRLENIVFKHDVSDEELFALYSNAVAFVSCSKMEGFGLPPLEAMSLSCPVLLSDIPSFREVCKHAAFYFDLHSVDSLRKQMTLVYNLDRKEKQEHVKRGLVRVKDFSWRNMVEKTLSIYNENNPISK